MAQDDEATLHLLVLVCYGITTLITCGVFYHSRISMSKSIYSTLVQISIFLNFMTILAGLLPTIFTWDRSNQILFALVSFTNALGFTLLSSIFIVAQTYFLRTIVPVGELHAERFVSATRIITIVNCIVGILSSFFDFLPHPLGMISFNVHTLSIAVNSIFDISLNAYMIRVMKRRFPKGSKYHTALVLVWISTIIILVVVGFLYTLLGQGLTNYHALTANLAYLHIPLSYSAIAIVRLMLSSRSKGAAKRAAAKANQEAPPPEEAYHNTPANSDMIPTTLPDASGMSLSESIENPSRPNVTRIS